MRFAIAGALGVASLRGFANASNDVAVPALEDFSVMERSNDTELEVDVFQRTLRQRRTRRKLKIQQQIEPGHGLMVTSGENARWYAESSASSGTPLNTAQSNGVQESCEVAAALQPVGCFPRDNASPPRTCRDCSDHIHLAPGKDDPSTSITISYTLDYSCGKRAETFVMVGKDPNDLDMKFIDYPGEIGHYTSTACMAEDPQHCKLKGVPFCHSEHFGTYISDWYHHVQTFGLSPNTKYYFKVDPPPCNNDLTYYFTTPSKIGQNFGMRLAIVGDTGLNNETLTTFNHVNEEDPDLLIIPGDIAYSDRNHRVWDEWFSSLGHVLSHTPLLVAPGNHDHDTDCCDYSTFKAYENRFQMPGVQPAEITPSCGEQTSSPLKNRGTYDYGNAFYSVKIGPTHIIVLNTYTDNSNGSKQFKWLKGELKSVDRIQTPWLIVVAHANLYEIFSRHEDEEAPQTMKKHFERLFTVYGVNFFFSGHSHACKSPKAFCGYINQYTAPNLSHSLHVDTSRFSFTSCILRRPP
jgi:predicted phosphodiesterase